MTSQLSARRTDGAGLIVEGFDQRAVIDGSGPAPSFAFANCFVQFYLSHDAVSLPTQASAIRVVAERGSPQFRVIGSVGLSSVGNNEQGVVRNAGHPL